MDDPGSSAASGFRYSLSSRARQPWASETGFCFCFHRFHPSQLFGSPSFFDSFSLRLLPPGFSLSLLLFLSARPFDRVSASLSPPMCLSSIGIFLLRSLPPSSCDTSLDILGPCRPRPHRRSLQLFRDNPQKMNYLEVEAFHCGIIWYYILKSAWQILS